jgi:hypothetical protein
MKERTLDFINPKPGELASDYIERMLGKNRTDLQKAQDIPQYQHYLRKWTLAQKTSV